MLNVTFHCASTGCSSSEPGVLTARRQALKHPLEHLDQDRRAQLIGIALVNLATVTWAANMTLGRWLRQDIGPITLSAARFSIASAGYAILLQRRPPEDRRWAPHRWQLVAMALCGVALFAPTLYLGLRFTTAVNATLINGCAPLITGLLAALLIREPMARHQLVGAVAGLAGVGLLISGSSPDFWSTASLSRGDLIILAACVLWALYSVLGRQVMRDRSALSTTAFSAFLALPLLVLAAIWELQSVSVSTSIPVLLAVLFIGLFPSLVGFLAWNEGVRRLGPSGAMVFYNTLPLYGTIFGVLLLGEVLWIWHLLGGALIIGGGLWAARTPVRARGTSE